MKEPTDAQVKEFWGKCGFAFHDGSGWMYGWYQEDKLVGQDIKLDLNNLFKYAVPFLIEELANSMAQKGAVDLDFCRLWMMKRWLRAWNDDPGDPALALFWVIREAM